MRIKNKWIGGIVIPLALVAALMAKPQPAPTTRAEATKTPQTTKDDKNSTAQGAQAASENNTTQEVALDEVVVQAENRVIGSKTDVPVHDTPASIITVPKEIIEEQMAIDMNSMVKNVSGVNPQLGGGYGLADSYTIRGLNMRFLRDGFSDGAAFNGYMRTMTDVESMEVLKGPGSALYGRNEPGGAINITTKKPLDHAHASVEGMVGFWNMHRLAADVGTPFIDNQLLTRMNVGYYKTDGYRGLSREIIEVLPTVTWKFTEKHALTLDYDFRNIKTRPDNYGILFDKNNNKLSAGSPSRTYYSPFNTAEQTINRISALYEGKFNEHLKLRSTLIYDDRSIFMVRNANVTVNTNDTVTNRDSRVQNDKIQTVLHQDEAVLKFNTGSWAHTVLAGFEFEYAKMNTARDSYKPLAAIGLSNPYPTESDYKSLPKTQNYDRLVELITTSAYAQEQVAFSKYVKARAGVRLDHVDASDKGIGTQPGNNTVQQRTISMARDLISYQAGLVYQPWEISSFYGGYSEGRYIAANTEAPYLYTEPETSSQLEFGNKLSLFKDKLQTNLAIFRTTRANYAFTDTNGNVNFLGGKRRTDGIELDVSGSPIAGLWIIFNSALMDSKVMTESTGTGVNAVDLAGKTPQNIPQYAGSLWTTYQIQNGFFKGLGFGGGPTYKSAVYLDIKNIMQVPGYVVADAVLFYKKEKWMAQINFRNITNTVYYTSPSFAGAMPGEPFNVVISAKASL